jgi:anti-sigma factor (TIGR02949 family)
MMKALGMIRCEDAMRQLWDFLDGELAEDDREALEKHLEVCGRCYPAYDFQRAYLEYTRRLATREQAPPDLRKRLFLKLLEQEGQGDAL